MTKPETPATVRAAVVKEMTSDNWRRRRRVMQAALIYIAVHVSYLVFLAPDDALRMNIGMALVGAGVGIIGSYVFGAVFDDRNRRDALTQIANEPGEPQ